MTARTVRSSSMPTRARGTVPTLTPNTVRALLEFTSFDVAGTDALTQGAGALNAGGAIELARRIDPAAAPGAPWVTSVPYPSTEIGGAVLPVDAAHRVGRPVCVRRHGLHQRAGVFPGHRLG